MHRLPVKGSGLMEKTATDQTTKRSSKTKRFTIQPPPLTGIYKVPVSGSLFAWEPEKDIRQGGLIGLSKRAMVTHEFKSQGSQYKRGGKILFERLRQLFACREQGFLPF
jgi:hypothetical protein